MIVNAGKTWHLQGRSYSYVLMENEEGDLLNFHFGGKIPTEDYSADPELWREAPTKTFNGINLGAYPQEYPSFGHRDNRDPAYEAENPYGNSVSRLKVRQYIVHSGESAEIPGMPALSASPGTDTLEVVLDDRSAGLEVRLFYVVMEDVDTLGRSALLVNRSSAPITLRRAYSMNLDLPDGAYDMIHLPGGWGRERSPERQPVHPGMKLEAQDTTGRGSRSVNPFVMLASPDATEEQGTVYGFSLIYSGNHSTVVQADDIRRLRIHQGIHPMGFSHTLQPGESFATPQCVLGYSAQGIGELSRQYHRTWREHLIRKDFPTRPVLVNSWESFYFDFDEDRLLQAAKQAKELGIDLFVLDDGWFGKRSSPDSSLGDWIVNREKLPSGIPGLAKKIADLGMQFGIWIEPEMISPDSDLYRAHPDWAVRTPQQEPVQIRNQYVLDLTQADVRAYITHAIGEVLSGGGISYVKWDMNRNITDAPRPGFFHAYTLGLYRIMDDLTKRFPAVLFEGCASGGGRFDAGVLAYMPQIWTSDNSDAVARLKIQYGTSLCYPVSTMAAHVTASPNHQVGRVTDLKTRADVAYAGVFGYELDVSRLTPEEKEEIKKQIAFARSVQKTVFQGDFYRLRSPFETNQCIWSCVDEDRCFLMACRVLTTVSTMHLLEEKVKLRGLDRDADYRDELTGAVYSGAMLMERGIRILYEQKDFSTVIMNLKKIGHSKP